MWSDKKFVSLFSLHNSNWWGSVNGYLPLIIRVIFNVLGRIPVLFHLRNWDS